MTETESEFLSEVEDDEEIVPKIRPRSFSGVGRLCFLTEDPSSGSVYIPSTVFEFNGHIDREELIRIVKEGVVDVPKNRRLRSRVNRVTQKFEEIPDFSDRYLHHHIRFLEKPEGQTPLDVFARAVLKPFSPSRPLWEMLVVDGDHGSVLCIRAHHVVGDGLSMGHTFMGMTREETEFREYVQKVFREMKLDTVWVKVKYVLWLLVMFIPTILYLLKMVLCDGRDDPPYDRKLLGPTRQMSVWWGVDDLLGDSTKLEDFKRIGRSVQPRATVNDVFLAIVSHGLTEYFGVRSLRYVRVAIPMNVRLTPLAERLANVIGGAMASIPLGPMSFRDRLRSVRESTKWLKRLPLPHYLWFGSVLHCFLPDWLLRPLNFLSEYTSFGSTNLPAPPICLTVGGVQVRRMCCFVPTVKTAAGFAFVSFNGTGTITCFSDPNVIEDPEELLDSMKTCFHDYLEELDGKRSVGKQKSE